MPTRSRTGSRRRVDGRTRSARAERRDTRAELVAAALEVFAERGYRDSSVDEIASRAGYSKGALYHHFASKDDLFFALLDEAIDQPWRETIELLGSAPAEHDMAPEASRRFAEVMGRHDRLLVVEHEYWSQAVRDPALRARYAERQREMRASAAKAISARLERLGAPPAEDGAAELATAFIALTVGLAQERLIEPEAVPEDLLGRVFALVYAGHVARSGASGSQEASTEPRLGRAPYPAGVGRGRWEGVSGLVANDDASLLLVELPIDLDALPAELHALGRSWQRKDELHVTVVSGPAAIEQAARVHGRERAAELVRSAVARREGAGGVRWAGLADDYRLTRRNGDETLVAMCEVEGIAELLGGVEAELVAPIEVPPTHVTLYTRGDAIGIGTRDQLHERTTRLTADEAEPLRTALAAALR